MSDLYKGVALPWDGSITGFIEPKDDLFIVKSSVLWIVMTCLGERVMNPEFGCPLNRAVFEVNDPSTANTVRQYVFDAIAKWDDRVEIVGFTTEAIGEELRCTLTFRMKKDPTNDNIQTVEFTLP